MGKNDEPKDDEPNIKPFVIDSQSPYFLHPSDSPGAIITTIKFNEKNYDFWEQAIQTALKAKNKLAFIEGKAPNSITRMETNLWRPMRGIW